MWYPSNVYTSNMSRFGKTIISVVRWTEEAIKWKMTFDAAATDKINTMRPKSSPHVWHVMHMYRIIYIWLNNNIIYCYLHICSRFRYFHWPSFSPHIHSCPRPPPHFISFPSRFRASLSAKHVFTCDNFPLRSFDIYRLPINLKCFQFVFIFIFFYSLERCVSIESTQNNKHIHRCCCYLLLCSSHSQDGMCEHRDHMHTKFCLKSAKLVCAMCTHVLI